jgi:hypothetical protein
MTPEEQEEWSMTHSSDGRLINFSDIPHIDLSKVKLMPLAPRMTELRKRTEEWAKAHPEEWAKIPELDI